MPSLFVDNLTVIDCALLDGERGLVGASWIVDLLLDGSLDEQGMLVDFGIIKSTIKQAIDTHIDHKLLYPKDYPDLSLLRQGECSVIEFTTASGEYYRHTSPADAICPVPGMLVDPVTVTEMATEILKQLMPDTIRAVQLSLREEDISGASYCYVHGLKQHQGNCQRIAHGHRSRIGISLNGERSSQQEQLWASRWRDIYIATADDLTPVEGPNGQASSRYAYQAEQGDFELILPTARCYTIDTQSTVENLASHLCRAISAEQPGDTVEVRAFEGVGKGAIASVTGK